MSGARLLKKSPIAAVYRRLGADCVEVAGWHIARHVVDLERERRALREAAVLVDWSHIGKVLIRGKSAARDAAKIDSRALQLAPLTSCRTAKTAILALTRDEMMVLSPPGSDAAIVQTLDGATSSVLNQSGGTGCFALAGPRRDEVIERSCATNLRRDRVPIGAAVQTTMHRVHCALLRTADADILLPAREYAQSLYEALLDVGSSPGLLPAGIATLPPRFDLGG